MSTQSFAEELEPFESWSTKRPQWSEDETEVAYAFTRCGALLMAIGRVFTENPATEDDVRRGKEVRDRGFELSLVGNMLAGIKGMSNESQLARFEFLYKSYAERIANSRRLHNNMFHGFMQSDFQFCVKIESKYRDYKKNQGTKSEQKSNS